MGDSDDEYDRKRRDKFRGERAEASYRGAERSARPRDDWAERDNWSRPRPREYRPRDRGYSPSMEPAAKRMRHDYYGGESYYNHYAPPYHQPTHREPPGVPVVPPVDAGHQPPMSFKAFLATQDDNISDSEAIEKYNDYKLDFQRQQLNEFFVAHKDDEWFRIKYHPEDSVKRKEEQQAALKRRLDVFLNLMNNGKIEGTSVDYSQTNNLLKLLDTVVIKLEGGTEEDLEFLEHEYKEMEVKNTEQKEKETTAEKVREVKEKPVEDSKKMESEESKESTTNGQVEESKPEDETQELNALDETNEKPDENTDSDKPEKGMMETQEKMQTDLNEEEGEVSKVEPPEEKPEQAMGEDEKAQPTEKEEPAEIEEKKPVKDKKRKRSYSGSSGSSSGSSSSSEDEADEDNNKDKSEEKKEDEKEVEEEKNGDKDDIEVISDDKPEKPRALHKTTSIFLRNLAPTITKQEVEAICAKYEGFLRVALADPQPERRWLRRGWVTFKRDANIKDICWNLNNIRLRDCELGAIVNRDLSRRIRPVNGIVAHKQVVRSDIRIAAKVILHLDEKAGMWNDGSEKKDKAQQSFGMLSNNPVLHNITDYLIEEASAEEEELLGLEPSVETQEAVTADRDETLIRVLDRLILYLRVVHSVDYYNHCEYPNEDEMPNRCGILHARGPAPTSKTDMTQFIGAPIETKMANFLPEKPAEEKDKNETKLIAMALKDVDTEVDKFVQANTRELAKDKWLCPLSGKKFKGPDFVRKHIFNKHGEKIEEVKKEVEFFNNYLKDPKRPMLAEPPQPKREEPPAFNHPGYGGFGMSGYSRPQYYGQGFGQRSRGYAPRARGGGPTDFGRPIIHYRDLDAPREPEEFI